jgi:hypothetical protein
MLITHPDSDLDVDSTMVVAEADMRSGKSAICDHRLNDLTLMNFGHNVGSTSGPGKSLIIFGAQANEMFDTT